MTEAADDDWSLDDVAGRYVARARRLSDLSQRELAMTLGVSQSAVARLEAGRNQPSLKLLSQILDLAGLALVVVDVQGVVAAPVPVALVRDNQGRRFPMHLDVDPPDQVPPQRRESYRDDRPEPRAWYALRPRRNVVREKSPARADEDHPTVAGLARRRSLMRGPQPTIGPAPQPEIECECLLECFERACLDQCLCQCEASLRPDWRA